MTEFFHANQRQLQDQMQTTRIADRIESTRRRTALNATDHEIIGAAHFFFLGSGAPDGSIDCSVKGGPAGFVQRTDDTTLRFPDYDGNGMFRSLGNIEATHKVALLFVEFWEKRKLRIRGTARVREEPEIVRSFAGAHLVVEVHVTDIFPNCPRYLPSLQLVEPSEYVQALGRQALEPAWKSKPDLADYVHERKVI